MIKFTKMQGTGNDYLIIDSRKRSVPNLKKLAVSISNRHYGVGSDGILILLNSKTADYRMRIFNPDGSEAEMCGNGIRSFAKYLYDNRIITKKQVDIETAAGIKKLVLNVTNKKVRSVVVNMGAPILQRERIPMIGKPGMVINEALRLDDGTTFDITSLS
ncbi:MAG TPA: diaminopimelate epimerase, partial [Spirochaetota bacterium]|nr:diaminopimelate epimerase [Spirochaetota bacterium]